MNSNLTLSSYVASFLVRAFASLVVCSVAIAGLAVTDYNATGNNYRYKEVNREFMVAFFSVTAFIEAVAGIMYIGLWAK